MDAIPLVRASAVLPFIFFLESAGVPIEKRALDVPLPQRALEDPESLVPINQALRLVDRIAAEEGIMDLGFHVGQVTRVAQLGAFGRLICGSLTLFDALSKASRLLQLQNPAEKVWLEPWGPKLRLCHCFAPSVVLGREWGDQFGLMVMIDCIRLAAGPRWLPLAIHLEDSTFRKTRSPVAFFGEVPVSRQDVSGIVFEPALLSLPLACSSSGSGTAVERNSAVLGADPPADDFLGSMRQIVRMFLRDQKADIAGIAEIAGMSTRTLQRRLAEEGADFSSLVDASRFEASLELLGDGGNKLTDIAFELGYNEMASFTRAFRRWSGFAPSEFRRLQSELQSHLRR